ncbi:type III pantothenate kinase [Pigmentiphaga aceris]|uniref:Type III pantothenate kinase n=1 Tax=Pigmentiphaga aceris TaxID=1940612 RepID=A0A5C0B420_9BURK|nr:type III pantothenate kinase [Pigmentiphaga aceris]QEI08606.1 type III pantothenate kinase [Pigmentiphaga aceris]
MMLLLDSGNSRLKVALVCQDAAGVWQYAAEPVALTHDAVETELPTWVAERLAERLAEPSPAGLAAHVATQATASLALTGSLQGAIGVNVAGPQAAERIARALLPCGIGSIDWQIPGDATLGLRNGYRVPTQLGSDRWMGLVGIWTSVDVQTAPASGQQPRQLVNFGTATTVDTISPDGVFVGGLIVPGWNLMRDALAQRTAQLPTAAGSVLDFPADTHDAITSGSAAAQAGAVLRQWMIARARFGAPPALYITGGASDAVIAEIAQLLALTGVLVPLHRVAHPVLDGLRAVLRQRANHAIGA